MPTFFVDVNVMLQAESDEAAWETVMEAVTNGTLLQLDRNLVVGEPQREEDLLLTQRK